jgi:hypothetical protein
MSKRCLSARAKSANIDEVSLYHSPKRINLSSLSEFEKQALANLMPLLICGEETAVLVFDDLAEALKNKLSDALIQDLKSITLDEIRHSDDLEELREHLPDTLDRRAVYRVAVFLKVLKSDDPINQLALLASLDAAVCQLLSTLLRAGNPLSSCSQVTDILRRIQLDEARHVRITRDSYLSLGLSCQEYSLAQSKVLKAFIALLKPAKNDFAYLGIDIESLFKHWNSKSDNYIIKSNKNSDYTFLQSQYV